MNTVNFLEEIQAIEDAIAKLKAFASRHPPHLVNELNQKLAAYEAYTTQLEDGNKTLSLKIATLEQTIVELREQITGKK